MVIDAGRASAGVESTVIDLSSSPYRVLREGAVSRRSITRILKGNGCLIGLEAG
jgi:tRNA A37 threonylcarbamoyladenosine synthetase subunit TsaC/SUA5/YrdC